MVGGGSAGAPSALAHVSRLSLLLLLCVQAHTCSNTLELPNYYAALKAGQPAPPSSNSDADLVAAVRAHLAAKLALAVEATEGYGLDTNEGFGGGGRGTASRATPAAAAAATVRGGGGGGSALGPLPLISPSQSALGGGGGGSKTASRAAAASVLDEDEVTGGAAGGPLRSDARGSALSLGPGSRAASMQRMVPSGTGAGGGRGSSGVVLPSALLDLSDEEEEEAAAAVATRGGRQQGQGLPGASKPSGMGATTQQQAAPRFTAAAGGRTVPPSSTAPYPAGAPTRGAAPAGSSALHTLASRADTPPLAASVPLQRTPSVSPSSNSMDDLEAELARAVGQQQRQQQGRAPPAGGVAGPTRGPGAGGFGITVSQRGVVAQPQQRPPQQNARATGSIVHGPGVQLAGAAGLGTPGASDDLLDLSLEAPPAAFAAGGGGAAADLRRPPVPSFTGSSSRASAAAAASLSRTPSSSQLGAAAGAAGAPPSARVGTPTPSAASQSRRHAAADQHASGSTGFAAPLRAAPSSKGLGGALGGSFSVGGSGSGGLVGRTPVKARLVPEPPEDASAGVVRIGDGPADDLDDLF